jgi:undecaprenyl-diphosphatase
MGRLNYEAAVLTMDFLQALFLAIVQGLTEFLPISSSAHLILVPELLGWPVSGLAFDVAVHVGTLLAVVMFLRTEIQKITFGWVGGFSTLKWNQDGLLGWMVVVATIPVGLVGLLLGDFIEAHLRTAFTIGLATLSFGLLLGWADRGAHAHTQKIPDMSFKHALWVGAAQALALIPGTSRSGITMTALLALGYQREAAARFSFLLAVPAISLPGLLKISELVNSQAPVNWSLLLLATGASAVTALFCMRWFIAFVMRVGMRPFVIYRIILAMIIFALLI